jgi:hypothetical protein
MQDRITNVRNVQFSGTGTPGASITYAETGASPTTVHTTIDPTGNYSITIPLGDGVNNFQVTSLDSFGQTISGRLATVTYNVNAP